VGIFAECVVDLYRHIELAETRFIDIGLQMRSPVLGSSADAPLPLYPRPAPQSAEYMPEMVVAGASMKKLMEEVQRAGRMDAPALIQGESGVGKELVARAYEGPIQEPIPIREGCSRQPMAALFFWMR
jgi:transcriptional regulator with GAF, ATPase, and Fis domain